jgi:hypothetical protein
MRFGCWSLLATLLFCDTAGCSLARSPIIETDAPAFDAGSRDVGPDAADAPPTDAPACEPRGCDDDNPCTDDSCGATGCAHTANSEACDDGRFCTTGDRCTAGACTVNDGAPCPSCNEVADTCGGCTTVDDCPLPTLGSCVYADACAESGTQTMTSFACTGGTCVSSGVPIPCARETNGMACGPVATTRGPCAGTGRSCSAAGSVEVTTTSFACAAGVCASSVSVSTEVCSHDPTGDACVSCTEGPCVAGGMGADTPCTGNAVRSCGDGICASVGTCVPGGPGMTEMVACTVPSGTACAQTTCGPCVRGGPSSPCQRMCSTTTGTCGGATCTPSSMSMSTMPCAPSMCGGG